MLRPRLNHSPTFKTLNLSFFRFFERSKPEKHAPHYTNTYKTTLLTYNLA